MILEYFAAVVALELAKVEARLQVQEAARRAQIKEAERQFKLLRAPHEKPHGVVIDVDAREVPDVQALLAPPTE